MIEAAIGEDRAAIYEGKKCVELYTRRWTQAAKPHAGDIYNGRVGKVDKSVGAAFVDLGTKTDGFLKFSMAPNAPRFREGQAIEVEVVRAAEAEKGPVLKFRATSETQTVSETQKVGRIAGDDLQAFIARRFSNDVSFETANVNSVEMACDREIAIPGGGSIAIDFTRALVAIDVDKGASNSGFAVGQSVAPLIADQLRLRGIGGLIVIDLPNVRQPRQREALHATMIEAFKDDPHKIKIAPMSRFGTVQMTRSKMGPSLDETINDRFGRPTVETRALTGLRRLVREGEIQGGARLTLFAPEDVMAWLKAGHIDWETAMTERIGARFKLEAGPHLDVKADR